MVVKGVDLKAASSALLLDITLQEAISKLGCKS